MRANLVNKNMEHEGPTLEYLTHRLSECPGEFLAEPRGKRRGTIDVTAIVCDLFRKLGVEPHSLDVRMFADRGGATDVNRLRLISAALAVGAVAVRCPIFRPGRGSALP